MPGCRAQAIDTARIPIESLAAELRMPEFRYSRFLDCARVIESSARFGLKPLCRSGATNPGRTAPPNEGPVLQPARANRKAQDQGDEAMNDAAVPARMQGIGAPASLALMNRVSELRQQGIHVFDFRERGDTPASAKDAAIEMLRSTDAASYTDVRGLAELREAVADKLLRVNHVRADPETEIMVSAGGMAGLFSTLLALTDVGDEVLISNPCWLGLEPMVRIAHGTPVRFPLVRTSGFAFDIEAMRERVTPRTRVLVLCNPDNPTGIVLGRPELEAIAETALESNLHVVVDEAYEHFVYDGREHVSLASLGDVRNRVITVQTTSKFYNMFGWRIGWVVADACIMQSILAVHSHAVSCPTSFAQAGAAAVLRESLGEGGVPVAELVATYQRRRNAMVEGLSGVPGVRCATPDGAYFTFPGFEHYGVPSTELCMYLLERGHVATTPGSVFGPAGEHHLRLVYNAPVEQIEEGVAQIADALSRIDPVSARGQG